MSNGFSVEQMLERIEIRLERLEVKLDAVVHNGCAHRPDDLDRIKRLEDRTWADRGIAGAVGAAVAAIGQWLRG